MIVSVPGGVVIAIRVIARAGRSGIAGSRGDALLVRLGAAPVDGAANDELIRLLSKILQVPRRAVTIVSGERSRQKRVQVSGPDVATVRSRLIAES